MKFTSPGKDEPILVLKTSLLGGERVQALTETVSEEQRRAPFVRDKDYRGL